MAELVRGGVTDRPWGRTFAALGLRGVTGQLTVVSEGKRFMVAFDRGAVVAAASPLASDAAVRVALTGHLVSSSQVPEISRRQAAAPERDEVAVIAELARLGPDHTLRLRRRVIAQRAARTFSLNHGEFVVTDHTELRIMPGCELDVRAVIYMGARTNLSEQRLSAELDQLGAWFRLRPELDDELPQFGFGDVEQPVIERLRDGGGLDELEEFAASFVDARTVRAVVYALAVYNACEVVAGAPARRRIATPVPEADEPSSGEPQALRGPPTQPMPRIAGEHPRRPTPPAGAPVAGPRARTPSPYMNTSPMPTIAPPLGDADESPRSTATGSDPALRRPDERESSARAKTGSDPALRRPPDERDGSARAKTGSDPALRRPPDERDSSVRRTGSHPAARMPPEEPVRDSSSRTRTTSSPSIRIPDERAVSSPSIRLPTEEGAPRRPPSEGDPRDARDVSVRGRMVGVARVPLVERTPESLPRMGGTASSPSIKLPGEEALRDDMTPINLPRMGAESGESPRRRRPTGDSSAQLVIRRIASRPPPTRRVARSDTAQSHEVKTLIAQRLKLLDQGADHFALLGVAPDAPPDALRKAYFALARQLHPDRLAALGISDDGRHAQRLFAQINTGFAVLSDAARRAQYVGVLRRGGEEAVRAEQARAEELARRILEAEEAFRRGEIALRRDQPQIALAEIETAVQLNPDEADYHAALAWAQFCAAADKAAIGQRTRTQLERAIQRAPKAVSARFYLGRVERMLGRDQEALRHFRDVIAASPGHADAAAEIRVLEAKLTGDKPGGGGFFGRKPR